MLSLKQGKKAVNYARAVIESYIKNIKIPLFNLEKTFNQKLGVFVTLHTFPTRNLRGCIGIPNPIMPLKNAIVEASQSATCDPRFPPLSESELNKIIIEITILTKPELIIVKHPKEYISAIKIGRDGLIVEKGLRTGLLLPQVPIEQNWNNEEFLTNTCMKAWLNPDAWLDKNTKIYKFSGQIFSELKPKGEIKEKNINGSNH